MFRDASLGHQLLLALGRVVSTKVYLSSKGVNQPVRQHAEVWRHKFLQQAIHSTAIVYGNGSVDHAMEKFPPSPEVLQDTFAAVFCGPESSHDVALSEAVRESMAREAMRKEVQLQVDKHLFQKQADYPLRHNYVYKDRGKLQADLVDQLPDVPAVPSCFDACAKWIPDNAAESDVTQAMESYLGVLFRNI